MNNETAKTHRPLCTIAENLNILVKKKMGVSVVKTPISIIIMFIFDLGVPFVATSRFRP